MTWTQKEFVASHITVGVPHAFSVGQKLHIDGDPRSVTRIIREKINATSFQFDTFKRVSRGYRRHVRRQKAKGA